MQLLDRCTVEKGFHQPLGRGNISGLRRRTVGVPFDCGFSRTDDDVRKGAPRSAACDLSYDDGNCTDGTEWEAHGGRTAETGRSACPSSASGRRTGPNLPTDHDRGSDEYRCLAWRRSATQKNCLAKLAMAMAITMPTIHRVWVFSVRSSSIRASKCSRVTVCA